MQKFCKLVNILKLTMNIRNILKVIYILSLYKISIEAKCSINKDEPFSIKCNGFQNYLDLDQNSSIKKIEYENLNAPIMPAIKTYAKVNTFICNKCGLEILYEKDFDYLKNLLYLDLSYNSIVELEPVFANVKSLDVLNLKGNKIKHLSRRIFADIQKLNVLDLSENKIRILHNATFMLPDLSTLILSDNAISDIDDNTFLGLESLTDLYLARNKIYDLSENCFRYNSQLNVLDLSGNKLDEVPLKTFSNTRKLQFLYLNGNNIRSIQKRLFHTLHDLQYLDISANKISKLSDSIFRNNMKLVSLSMGYNKINQISSKTYQDLDNLKHLYLQHNKLDILNNSIFEHLTNLHTLNLAFNNIESVSRKAFNGLENLSILVLTGNPISIQDVPLLPKRLIDIYMHHCSESIIYIQEYFEIYPKLRHLYCVEEVWVERLDGLIVDISADSGQALDSAQSDKKITSRFYANVLVNSSIT